MAYNLSDAALEQRRKAGFKPGEREEWRQIRMPAWMLAEILAATPIKTGAMWKKIRALIKKEEMNNAR